MISPALKSELVIFNAEGFRNIILDLSHVEHMDSSGLSCLLTANRICQNSDGSFVLTGVKPSVEQLISITQLDKSLQIVPTKEEAIDYVFRSEEHTSELQSCESLVCRLLLEKKKEKN